MSKAIERLKAKHFTAPFTLEDLATINQIDKSKEEEKTTETSTIMLSGLSTRKIPYFFAASGECKVEQHFAMSAFSHGRGLDEE